MNASNGQAQLEGIQLVRSFGTREALSVAVREVSLSVFPGQFTVLMGPSGCGKSTLLSLLSGLLPPNQGKVMAFGSDLWAMDGKRLREFRWQHFGFIFQAHNLFPTLTALEQLQMVLILGERATPREASLRAMALLDVLGLGGKGHLLPGQLSGGEKQRVAVARAMIKNPPICFADEPTAALDWHHGQNVIELLHEATRKQNAAVLLVTHDPRIRPYADQLFKMEDGAVERVDI